MSTAYYFDSGINDTPVADPKIVEINDTKLIYLKTGGEAKVYKIIIKKEEEEEEGEGEGEEEKKEEKTHPNKVIKLYHNELNNFNREKYAREILLSLYLNAPDDFFPKLYILLKEKAPVSSISLGLNPSSHLSTPKKQKVLPDYKTSIEFEKVLSNFIEFIAVFMDEKPEIQRFGYSMAKLDKMFKPDIENLPKFTKDFFEESLKTLKSLKKLGYSNFDIKPDNTMLNNGIPTMIDYGGCIKLSDHVNKKIDTSFFTPAFMHPELTNLNGIKLDYIEYINGFQLIITYFSILGSPWSWGSFFDIGIAEASIIMFNLYKLNRVILKYRKISANANADDKKTFDDLLTKIEKYLDTVLDKLDNEDNYPNFSVYRAKLREQFLICFKMEGNIDLTFGDNQLPTYESNVGGSSKKSHKLKTKYIKKLKPKPTRKRTRERTRKRTRKRKSKSSKKRKSKKKKKSKKK